MLTKESRKNVARMTNIFFAPFVPLWDGFLTLPMIGYYVLDLRKDCLPTKGVSEDDKVKAFGSMGYTGMGLALPTIFRDSWFIQQPTNAYVPTTVRCYARLVAA